MLAGEMTVYETTNHNTIYHWVTARGLYPACVVGSPDRIRIGGDDSANTGEDLEPLEWWRWFKEFENRQLMLIYDPSKGWYTLGSRKAPTGGMSLRPLRRCRGGHAIGGIPAYSC